MKNLYEIDIHYTYEDLDVMPEYTFNWRKFRFKRLNPKPVYKSGYLSENYHSSFKTKIVYVNNETEAREKFGKMLNWKRMAENTIKEINTYYDYSFKTVSEDYKVEDISLVVCNANNYSFDVIRDKMTQADFMEYLRDNGIGLRIDDIN